MSSHFNYEIDERNLRSRLKDMNVPLKEEAWIRFENYSDLHKASHKSSALPSFHLNINRALVLPFVFGGVVILFSLLLFNFISIKNKNVSDAVKTNPIAEKKVEPKKEIPAPKVTVTELKEQKADSIQIKETIPPPVATVALTPTIQNTVVETKPVPANTVAAISADGSWTSLGTAKIYTSPNIASDVIGSSNTNQNYTALEETNYFIKISFTKDNKTETGFIRKDLLRKNNGQSFNTNGTLGTIKKKNKKAETLEAIQTPMMLSGSGEEKEPDLK